jgi:hypothetical protein
MLSNADTDASTVAERRLSILFVVQRATLLRFALLIPCLADRGHRIHVSFASGRGWDARRAASAEPRMPPPQALELIADLHARFPDVTWDLAPQRLDAWRDVAWLVRGLADLAHNAHPRYARARVLRSRTKSRILRRMRTPGEFEPVARWIALRIGNRLTSRIDATYRRRVLKATARLEDAIPTSAAVDAYVRGHDPDIVVATGTFRHASDEVEPLKSARGLGIPTGIVVPSWDNLTNKGTLKFLPERVILWNTVQARDATELHDIPADRIRATGAHGFDQWFERRPARTKEELYAEVGLDPAAPYVVYLCSSRNIARGGELAFVLAWITALRASSDERIRSIGVIVRPHPNAADRWQGVDLGAENAFVWPPAAEHPVAEHARTDFFDTLVHSAAVVGINTTAMIEAAVLGKDVLTVLVPDFAQETTLHFHYLLTENGGFLHVAADLDEHVEQLRAVLGEHTQGAAQRRFGFVESFVRPGGIDLPAAPLTAAAIEEIADLPVQRSRRRGVVLIRGVLAVEVGLNAAYGAYRRLRER